ncbi:MAG: hypothetical protein EZS28_039295, partial [Streblomastix strix]
RLITKVHRQGSQATERNEEQSQKVQIEHNLLKQDIVRVTNLNHELERQLALTRPSIKTPVQPSGTDVPFTVTVNLDNDQLGINTMEQFYTSLKDDYKNFILEPEITKDVIRLEIIPDFIRSLYLGVVNSGTTVPKGNNINESMSTHKAAFFHNNGSVYHKGIPKAGNNKMISNQKVAIEVNMNSNPRTAHLFIDGKQQPVFISGLPSSIQFFFQLYYEDDQIQILSLKRLNEPTVQIVEKADEVKYYVNKAL